MANPMSLLARGIWTQKAFLGGCSKDSTDQRCREKQLEG